MPARQLASHKVDMIVGAQDKTKSVFDKIGKAFPRLGKIAGMAAAGITAAFVATGAAVTALLTNFAPYESALVDMGQITGESLESINKKIMDLPNELGTATDLVKGYYSVISAGVTDPKAAMDLLTTAAKTANAGHLDLQTTIEVITKTMKGFGDNIKDTTDASDFLWQTAKLGQTSMQELAPLMGGVAATAKELGLSVDETGGSIAQLTQFAGSSSQAVDQLSGLMIVLMKSNTELDKVYKALNVTSGKALIKQEGFAGAMQKIKEEADKTGTSIASLVGKKQALQATLALTGENLKDTTALIDKMGERAGATEKNFDDWKDTLAAVWKTFKTTIGKIAIEMAEQLAPDVKQVLTDISTWLKANQSNIVEWTKGFIGGFKNILSALEPFKNAVVAAFTFLANKIPPIIKFVVDVLKDFQAGFTGVETEADKAATGVEGAVDRINNVNIDPRPIAGASEDLAFSIKGFANIVGAMWDSLWEFSEVAEEWKTLFFGWVREMIDKAVDFAAGWLSALSKISGGPSLNEVLFGKEDVAQKAASELPKVESLFVTSIENINKTLAGLAEVPVTINTDPAQEELKELTRQAIDLEERFKDMNLTVTVSKDGILELSNFKSDLESPAWDLALAKNFTVETDAALTDIAGVKTGLEEITETETVATVTLDTTDITKKMAATKVAVTQTAAEFIKLNEKLLEPFRNAAGDLPAEISEALNAGRQVIISEGGFIIVNAIEEMGNKVDEATPELEKKFFELGDLSLEALVDGLQSNTSLTTAEIRTVMNEIQLAATNAIGTNFEDAGVSIMNEVAKGINNWKTLPAEQFEEAMVEIDKLMPHSDAEKGPMSKLSEVGPAIMTTITDGIKSSAPQMKAALLDAFEDALDAIESVIQKVQPLPKIEFESNVAEILKQVESIVEAVEDIPRPLMIMLGLETGHFDQNLARSIETLDASFDDPEWVVLDLDYTPLSLGVDKAIKKLGEVPAERETLQKFDAVQATIAVDDFIDTLLRIPERIKSRIDFDISSVESGVARFRKLMDSLPVETVRSLILKVKTEASPRMDFTKGMEYIARKLHGLPDEGDFVIKFHPGAGQFESFIKGALEKATQGFSTEGTIRGPGGGAFVEGVGYIDKETLDMILRGEHAPGFPTQSKAVQDILAAVRAADVGVSSPSISGEVPIEFTPNRPKDLRFFGGQQGLGIGVNPPGGPNRMQQNIKINVTINASKDDIKNADKLVKMVGQKLADDLDMGRATALNNSFVRIARSPQR